MSRTDDTNQPTVHTDVESSHAVIRISVLVSRFPKFTETFVVNQAVALQRLGVQVDVDALLPVEPRPHQPAARLLVDEGHFGAPWGRHAFSAFTARAIAQPTTLARIIWLLFTRAWRRPSVLLKDLSLLPRVCAIADDLERRKTQHVHAHFATHAGFAAFCIGRLTGIPYSIVAHGSDVHRHQVMLAEKMAEAAFVATVSSYNRQVMRSICDASIGDRIEVVRSGVDISNVELAKTAIGDGEFAPQGTPLLLCVGTLHEVKGQQHLVRAMFELRDRGRSLRLQLVGEGEDRVYLERLIRDMRLASCVEMVGSVPHDEVLRRAAAATIVIAPSVASSDGRKEGIPTVLIEAMACGTNVIASDLAGIPELVEHEVTGLLTPPGDAEGIADAVELLLDNRNLAKRLAIAARSRVSDEYDLDRTAARMYGLMNRSAS